MNFNSIPPKSSLFIDANIFIYHFTGLSEQCSELLERCERREIKGIISVNIFAEILHRLMMIEAVSKRLVAPSNIVKKIKANPQIIKNLSDCYLNNLKVLKMNIKVLPLSEEILEHLPKYCQDHGLMVNDALILAVMLREGIENLASSDKDFKSIPEIKLYSPEDI